MLKTFLSVAILMAGFLSPAIAKAENRTELLFILCGGTSVLQFYEAAITTFETQNPGVDVVVENLPWGTCEGKATTLAAAGDPPDLAYLGTRNLRQLADAGMIIPINISQLRKDNYQTNVLSTVRINGQYWGYPRALSTKALFMNCDIFKDAGLACKPPETWDELYTVAKTIKEKTDAAGMGLSGKNFNTTVHQFLNYLYSNGGQVMDPDTGKITLDSKEGLETLKFYGKLAEVSQVGPTAHERSQVKDLFVDGQIAMYIDGPWARQQHTGLDNVAVGLVPAGPNGKHSSVLVSDAVVVFKGSGNEKLAAQFAKTLTEVDSQYIIDDPANWGLTPMYKYHELGIKDPYYLNSAYWKPFVAAISSGKPEPMFSNFSATQNVITSMIQGLLLGDDSAENLLAEAVLELEELK